MMCSTWAIPSFFLLLLLVETPLLALLPLPQPLAVEAKAACIVLVSLAAIHGELVNSWSKNDVDLSILLG
jgi:hypothetical protein